MSKMLDILDRQLELGQTKIISHDNGKIIDFIELLFSPTVKAQFAPSVDNKGIDFCIKDVDLELPQHQSRLNKNTLRDLIISLQKLYNQTDSDEMGEL